MKVNHEEYLKQTLKSKKMELEALKVNRMIRMAEDDTKEKMLQNQIDSIERQLQK